MVESASFTPKHIPIALARMTFTASLDLSANHFAATSRIPRFTLLCKALSGRADARAAVPQVATRGGGMGWLRDGSIPLRFQGVAAPLIKRSRSLAAQTGWLVNSNKLWIACRH